MQARQIPHRVSLGICLLLLTLAGSGPLAAIQAHPQTTQPQAHPQTAQPPQSLSQPAASPAKTDKVRHGKLARPAPEWLQRISAVLDASLAASLAGLAIAVAVFLLAYVAPVVKDIEEIRMRGGNPKQEKVQEKNSCETATQQAFRAFYFFVGFLIEGVTVHPLAQAQAQEITRYTVTLVSLDVAAAGSCLAAGLIFLWRSANTMRTLVMS